MKVWILSDLHLEFSGLSKLEMPDADICVVSGDIQSNGIVNSLQWLNDRVAMSKVYIYLKMHR